jgi:hypothetical protein
MAAAAHRKSALYLHHGIHGGRLSMPEAPSLPGHCSLAIVLAGIPPKSGVDRRTRNLMYCSPSAGRVGGLFGRQSLPLTTWEMQGADG